ncbi:MAG TPA: phage tail length tape measure family protein [Hanamia sp.]|nr:phage tail length tape measure family protein [Hanamia sp.]
MASTIVEYVMNLKDNLSPKIDDATTHVKHMESGLGSLKSMAESVGLALSAAFVVTKGFEFIKESIESAKDLITAQAEVKAGLESTNNAAGITFENIEKVTDQLYHSSTFARDQIMDMQSILVTFPAITREAFGPASQAITDMATRMHQDLKDTVIQVGKALQDPVRGSMALHRVGVNLSQEQLANIKKLVAAGDKLKAQQLIMKELQNEFAGSAQAAYNVDPVIAFSKEMGDIKDKVGELVMKVEEKLTPVLMTLIKDLKEVWHWIKENKETIIPIITVIGTYAAILGTVATVTKLWTGAVWLLNVALDANPIVLAIAAVAGLIVWLYRIHNSTETWTDSLKALWDMVKNVTGLIGIGFKSAFEDVVDNAKIFWLELKDVWNQGVHALTGMEDPLTKVIDDLKKHNSESQASYMQMMENYRNGIKMDWSGEFTNLEWLKRQHEISAKYLADKKMKSLIGKGGKGSKGGDGKDGSPAPKTKAEGQKNINIHIAYNAPLIKDFTISTINMKEGLGSLKEKVTAILEGATHDSLIVAAY